MNRLTNDIKQRKKIIERIDAKNKDVIVLKSDQPAVWMSSRA